MMILLYTESTRKKISRPFQFYFLISSPHKDKNGIKNVSFLSTFQSEKRGINCWLKHRLCFILYIGIKTLMSALLARLSSICLSLYLYLPKVAPRLGKTLRGYISLHTYIHIAPRKRLSCQQIYTVPDLSTLNS